MRYILVYDSDCGPCSRFRDAVGFLDPRHRMGYLGLDEAEGLGLLSTVPPARRRRSFHLVSDEGGVASGSAALARLASQLPGGSLTSLAVGANPALSRAAGFVYAALSRLHDAGSCSASRRP